MIPRQLLLDPFHVVRRHSGATTCTFAKQGLLGKTECGDQQPEAEDQALADHRCACSSPQIKVVLGW